MGCPWCFNTGYVLAYPKSEELSGCYSYRCGCVLGDQKRSTIPKWQTVYEDRMIPEYVDELPKESWVIDQFEKGLTQSEEFQKRLKIWGRERFVKIWESYKQKKKELDKEEKKE